MSIRSFLSVAITGLVVLLLWDRCVFRFERPESLVSICLLGASAWATMADVFSGATQSQVTDLLLRGIMINYGLAAYSLYVQAEGLSGKTGLLPLSTQLAKTKRWVDDASARLALSRGSSDWYLRSIRYILTLVLELFKDATSVALVSGSTFSN